MLLIVRKEELFSVTTVVISERKDQRMLENESAFDCYFGGDDAIFLFHVSCKRAFREVERKCEREAREGNTLKILSRSDKIVTSIGAAGGG